MDEPACAVEQLCPHGFPPDRVCYQCPDPCVVDAEPVSVIIASFVEQWRVERPSRKGRYAADDDGEPDDGIEPVAPYVFLAVDTGLADFHAAKHGRSVPTDDDIAAAERDIRRARNAARHPNIELRVADRLVASIGEPSMFDTLEIRPNPRAPAHRHGECCGGSLTGSGH